MTAMYCVRYALTNGVEEFEANVCANPKYVRSSESFLSPLLLIGRDAFYTRWDAIVAAENKRRKKVNSLKKQIEKLEALTFE